MVDRRAMKDAFRLAVRNRDPMALKQILNVPAVAAARRVPPPSSGQNQGTVKEDGIDYTSVANAWIDAYEAAEAGYAAKCYDSQAALHTALNSVLSSSTGNWLIPGLQTVCKNTHRIALAADRASDSPSDNTKLQNAVSILQESYSRTSNDRKDYDPEAPYNEHGSKKAGVLFIVNELFSIYFRLNTLRLCKNLVKPVETRKLHEQSTMGQMVTYRYYIGRLNLFEDQYESAEENLEYALNHCPANAVHNKRCILRYLVPVKMCRGRLPTPELLAKYALHEFESVVAAIRKGDLRKFNDEVIQYQDRFIRQGTYLLLEKCKTICYRNLFKRIYLILEKHQISLNHVAKSFKWLGMPIDLDEVECILANLIYRGYIRGYLSHAKRVLVLSKRDPFPQTVPR